MSWGCVSSPVKSYEEARKAPIVMSTTAMRRAGEGEPLKETDTGDWDWQGS